MFELIKVTEKCYYIQSPAKIGIILTDDNSVCLIDSGSDKDAGRKIRQVLDKNGWTLKAIYNTHSNADHIGGNKFLQSRTNCKIYAPGTECDFTNHPILEPAFLYGGYPVNELKHKFIFAEQSDCLPLTADVLPDNIEVIDLPGHFFDMVGFRTDEDIVFLADCLSSKETLDKYKIGFIYDVAAYLETLENVKNMKAKLFIPSHANATDSIAELAGYNIEKTNEIADRIAEICKRKLCFEDILQIIFMDFSLTMNFQQYTLIGSTVRSYLTYLRNIGKVQCEFKDNKLLWFNIE